MCVVLSPLLLLLLIFSVMEQIVGSRHVISPTKITISANKVLLFFGSFSPPRQLSPHPYSPALLSSLWCPSAPLSLGYHQSPSPLFTNRHSLEHHHHLFFFSFSFGEDHLDQHLLSSVFICCITINPFFLSWRGASTSGTIIISLLLCCPLTPR